MFSQFRGDQSHFYPPKEPHTRDGGGEVDFLQFFPEFLWWILSHTQKASNPCVFESQDKNGPFIFATLWYVLGINPLTFSQIPVQRSTIRRSFTNSPGGLLHSTYIWCLVSPFSGFPGRRHLYVNGDSSPSEGRHPGPQRFLGYVLFHGCTVSQHIINLHSAPVLFVKGYKNRGVWELGSL